MKRIIVASLAVLLVSGAVSMANAKSDKQPKVKPKLALMVKGKVTQEVLPTAEKETPGVGTDYTFEWSGGKGDIMITGGD